MLSLTRYIGGTLANHTFVVAGVKRISIWMRQCAFETQFLQNITCKQPGLSIEMLQLMSQSLGFRYRLLWFESYSEMQEAIADGTADFSLNFQVATAEIADRFALLPPLNYFEIGFVTQTPDDGMRGAMPLLMPFKLSTWMGLLAVVAVVFALLVAVGGCSLEWSGRVGFHLFGYCFNQFDIVDPSMLARYGKLSVSLRLLSVFNAVFVLLMQTLYNGSMIAYLYPSRGSIPFSSSADLAPLVEARTRPLLTRDFMTFYFSYIYNSTAAGHLAMRRAVAVAGVVYADVDYVRQLQADKLLVLPTTSATYAEIAEKHCGFSFVKDASLTDVWETVIVRKDFRHLKLFKKAARFIKTVLRIRLIRDYSPKQGIEKCTRDIDQHKERPPLGPRPMSPILLTLVVGLTLVAGSGFVAELLVARCRSSDRRPVIDNEIDGDLCDRRDPNSIPGFRFVKASAEHLY